MTCARKLNLQKHKVCFSSAFCAIKLKYNALSAVVGFFFFLILNCETKLTCSPQKLQSNYYTDMFQIRVYRNVSCNIGWFVVKVKQQDCATSTPLKNGTNEHADFKNCWCKLNYSPKPPFNQPSCSPRTQLWHWKQTFHLRLKGGKRRCKPLASTSQDCICWFWTNTQKREGRIHCPSR